MTNILTCPSTILPITYGAKKPHAFDAAFVNPYKVPA